MIQFRLGKGPARGRRLSRPGNPWVPREDKTSAKRRRRRDHISNAFNQGIKEQEESLLLHVKKKKKAGDSTERVNRFSRGKKSPTEPKDGRGTQCGGGSTEGALRE